jgi:hypothetical protein
MPFFRSGAQILYYAHVPKCAGSSVEEYLTNRFGALAFCDTAYMQQTTPWTASSPQHVDRDVLARLFPPSFMDASFTVVRHPVARVVSAWHFQLEVEKTVPAGVTFSDWLMDLGEQWVERPYAFDNHTRPMNNLVPDGAEVFYMEHGLDGIIPWLDRTTGTQTGPRFIGEVNKRAKGGKDATAKVKPSETDLETIFSLYKADFERFGYSLEAKLPSEPAPVLSEDIIKQRDLERLKANNKVTKLITKIRKKI